MAAVTPSSLHTSPSPSCVRSVETPLAEELIYYKSKCSSLVGDNERLVEMISQKEVEAKQTLNEMKTHYRHKKLKYKRRIREAETSKKQLHEVLLKTREEIQLKEKQQSENTGRLGEYFHELHKTRQDKIETEEKLIKATRDLRMHERMLFEAKDRERASSEKLKEEMQAAEEQREAERVQSEE